MNFFRKQLGRYTTNTSFHETYEHAFKKILFPDKKSKMVSLRAKRRYFYFNTIGQAECCLVEKKLSAIFGISKNLPTEGRVKWSDCGPVYSRSMVVFDSEPKSGFQKHGIYW